jgi:signal transduction histidine kinase
MTTEHLNKLFEPFFTTKYGGTGLGLTISHSIIDGHGGSINVKSQPGQGTTFVVTLPVIH